jgi:hypothetical protein
MSVLSGAVTSNNDVAAVLANICNIRRLIPVDNDYKVLTVSWKLTNLYLISTSADVCLYYCLYIWW